MPSKRHNTKGSGSSRPKNPDTAMAFVATFFGIIGFLIAFIAKRDDKYVMFYAKQSLILFLLCFALGIINQVPFLGTIISLLGSLLVIVLWVVQWVNALSGEMRPSPIIGDLAEKIKL